jgi:hypothetical protein
VVLDFEGAGLAGVDRIDLAGIDANAGTGGNQSFIFRGAIDGASGARSLWLSDEGGDTVIHGNVDRDEDAEFMLRIDDGDVLASAYTANDFIL